MEFPEPFGGSLGPVPCELNSGKQAPAPVPGFAQQRVEPGSRPENCRFLKDGGGKYSNGDWSFPRETDSLSSLREVFQRRLSEWGLHRLGKTRIQAAEKLDAGNLDEQAKAVLEDFVAKPWLTPEQGATLAADIQAFSTSQGVPCDLGVVPGQPFRLSLWHALCRLTGDKDLKLHSILATGVPTGIHEEVEPSGIWSRPSKDCRESCDSDDLRICEENWQSADKHYDTALELIEADLKKGFLQEWFHDLDTARRRWPKGVAVGKLAVILAEGKKPRLVGDSTACMSNPSSFLPERTENPTIGEVDQALGWLHEDCGTEDIEGALLDVESAHKLILVQEEDRGMQMFRLGERLFYYRTCHFGAKWSAWWWARSSASLLRLVHIFLHFFHFTFCYVDDWFFIFRKQHSLDDLLLVIMLLVALGCPLSWKKVRLGRKVSFLGFAVNLNECCLGISAVRADRGISLLLQLQPGMRVTRRFLESTCGLMMWISWIAPHIRPFLADLFRNRNKGVKRTVMIGAESWVHLVQLINASARVSFSSASFPQLKPGWRLIAADSCKIRSVLDLARVQPSAGCKVCCIFLDFDTERITVTEECARASLFLRSALRGFPQLKSCKVRAKAVGAAAADAHATRDVAEIGGWWSELPEPSDVGSVRWFHCRLRKHDFPDWFALHDNHQLDIAFYEAIAQCVLAALRLQTEHVTLPVCLTQLCDNQPTVGASRKCFTSAAPLCYALQMLSVICCKFDAEPEISFLPGKQNIWADRISRLSSHPLFASQLNQELEVGICVQDLVREVWFSH